MQLLQRPRRPADRLKILWVLTWWKAANGLIRAVRFLLFKQNPRPRKILVFRTGSIGDSICALPAMSNIRAHFAESVIHLLTNAGKGHRNLVSIEVLIEPGVFDDIINYENLTRGELIRRLRAEQYDLVIHLTQYNAPVKRLLRDMFFFRFAAAVPAGFGWRYDSIMVFRQTQAKHLRAPNERERLNAILQENNIHVPAQDQFPFQVERSDELKVNALLEALPPSDRPAIAVVPGAKRPQNRWPIAYFAEVVRHLSQEFDIFIIGGLDDEALAQPLLTTPNTYSFCGQLSPVQSGLLMQRCRLVLSNDTGPMHLAYSFNVPVVALFSNRDFPHRWFPPENDRNTVLRASDVHCAICLSDTCANNICMQKITPPEVIFQIETLLQKTHVHNLLCAASPE